MQSWVERQWPGTARSKVFDTAWAAILAVISVGSLWVEARGGPEPGMRRVDALGVAPALTASAS